MKIGITIPNYYSQYLDEIANLNNSNKTAVCSLIVENFLSYNKKQNKFPLFRKDVRIVFANETVFERSRNSNSSADSSSSLGQDCEQLTIDRDSLIEQLELVPEDPEDSGLPFDYESED